MKDSHTLTRKLWNNGRWDLISAVTGSRLLPCQARRALLRRVCAHVGAARILAGFHLNNRHLYIGDDVFINDGATIDCNVLVRIEDGVAIGSGCTIITSGHLVGPPEMRRRAIRYGEVRIGAGSWLATNVTVLPGSTIGPGCVIAAGAVVRGDLPANGMYAGVPARRIKDLPTDPGELEQPE